MPSGCKAEHADCAALDHNNMAGNIDTCNKNGKITVAFKMLSGS